LKEKAIFNELIVSHGKKFGRIQLSFINN